MTTPPNIPRIDKFGGQYVFEWPDATVYVHRVTQKGTEMHARYVIKTDLPGYGPYLSHGSLNLTSQMMRRSLVKELEERCPQSAANLDWHVIVSQFTLKVIEEETKGCEPVPLEMDKEYPSTDWILKPIIPKGEETVFFGPRDSGKSYICLFLCLCAQEPGVASKFGWYAAEEDNNILILDWETQESTVGWRWNALLRGLQVTTPKRRYYYKRCTASLQDMVDEIQHDIYRLRVKTIIVDSIAKAVHGDINSYETSNKFFTAVRALECSTILVGHTSKEKGKFKSVLGAGQFENDPRMIWEVVKTDGQNGSFDIGLFHRKSNVSPKFPPIALNFNINEEQQLVSVACSSVSQVPEFAGHRSARDRIFEYLDEWSGMASTEKISSDLEIPRNTVQETLRRGRDDWCVKLDRDTWGLKGHEFE